MRYADKQIDRLITERETEKASKLLLLEELKSLVNAIKTHTYKEFYGGKEIPYERIESVLLSAVRLITKIEGKEYEKK
jgi:hypothetical protein